MKPKKGQNNQFPPDVPRNPFDTYNRTWMNEMNRPSSVFSANPVAGAEEMQARQAASNQQPIPVALPPHLFTPPDAQTIDISALANVPPSTTVDLLVFTAPKGGWVNFLGYAIFNDSLNLALINLVPTINGARVLPFNGNPQLNFKLGLGVSPDLATLIPVQLNMQPNDVLKWTFTNNDVVDVAAGVRMNGYFTQGIVRGIGRQGG